MIFHQKWHNQYIARNDIKKKMCSTLINSKNYSEFLGWRQASRMAIQKKRLKADREISNKPKNTKHLSQCFGIHWESRQTSHRTFSKLFNFINHLFVSADKRGSLVQLVRFNVHDSGMTITGFSTSLFRQKSHGIAFVKESEFSIWIFGAFRVHVNTPFDEVPVKIRN